MVVVKVCAIAAQPGHTKELQSVQLERGLRIVDSPGVIFEDDDRIQGQKESSVLLRNVVKSEDVDDPISVGGCASSACSSSRSHVRIVTS
jgi:nuclear GTP-binding protein